MSQDHPHPSRRPHGHRLCGCGHQPWRESLSSLLPPSVPPDIAQGWGRRGPCPHRVSSPSQREGRHGREFPWAGGCHQVTQSPRGCRKRLISCGLRKGKGEGGQLGARNEDESQHAGPELPVSVRPGGACSVLEPLRPLLFWKVGGVCSLPALVSGLGAVPPGGCLDMAAGVWEIGPRTVFAEATELKAGRAGWFSCLHQGKHWAPRCPPPATPWPPPARKGGCLRLSDGEHLFQTNCAALPVPAWNGGGDCDRP